MKTVFVLVDALKSLYLTEDNMPFLYSLSRQGYYIKQVIPCAGFCERSEIFSGLDGFDTGNFTAIGYLPEYSPYKHDRFVLRFACIIELFCKILSRKMFSKWRQISGRPMSAYKIPYKSLNKFALTEDGIVQLIPHSTIFQEMERNGLMYTMDGFTSLSDLGKRSQLSLLDLAALEISKGTDFIPLYIGDIDYAGHLFGDEVEKIKPYLLNVDNQLQRIYQQAANAGYSFCVLGDHGMVPVTKKVDVIRVVKSAGCRLHKDYEAFYDSTLARFWFHNDNSKNRIKQILSEQLSQDGFMVDGGNYVDYHIPLDVKNKEGRPVYGDIVWCANPGVLISPDYFHSENVSEKGMHGYIEVVEGHGTGLFVQMHNGINSEVINRAHSSSICGILCKTLGIKAPNTINFARNIKM